MLHSGRDSPHSSTEVVFDPVVVMPLGVFISHSVGPVELPIVEKLSAVLTGTGVTPYLAMYDRQAGVLLSAKVQEHIRQSDVLLAVLTAKGTEAAWVHDEIGFALGKDLRVLPFVEKGVDVKGMLKGVEAYEFDPSAPEGAIERVTHDLALLSERKERASLTKQLEDMDKQLQEVEIVVGIVLAVVLVVFLAWALSRE